MLALHVDSSLNNSSFPRCLWYTIVVVCVRTFAVTCKFNLLFVFALCLLRVLCRLCARTDLKTTIGACMESLDMRFGSFAISFLRPVSLKAGA